MSARYASRALPASDEEGAAFERTVRLWRLAADSYARVAQLGSDSDVHRQLALVCQRCLSYAGQCLIEYYRARRAIAPGLWMELHGYFDTADDWGLIREPVSDALGLFGSTTSCAESYAAVLLVDLANPYSRTPRELSWILRWAHLLAPATAVNLPDEDAGPTKAWLVLHRDDPEVRPYFERAYGKRPKYQVFDRKKDPHEIDNVAEDPDYAGVRARLLADLLALTASGIAAEEPRAAPAAVSEQGWPPHMHGRR